MKNIKKTKKKRQKNNTKHKNNLLYVPSSTVLILWYHDGGASLVINNNWIPQHHSSQMSSISSRVLLLACLFNPPSFAPLYLSYNTCSLLLGWKAQQLPCPALYHDAHMPTHKMHNGFSWKNVHKYLCLGWKVHVILWFQSQRIVENCIQKKDIE